MNADDGLVDEGFSTLRTWNDQGPAKEIDCNTIVML